MQPNSSDFDNLYTGDNGAPYFPAMHSICNLSELVDDGSGCLGGDMLAVKDEDEEGDEKYMMKTAMAEAKAVAASQNHKEAEKRRRHRINSHLDTLRTLLPSNSRTDKASLLGKVVEQLRELKRQWSECLPSETDDVMVVVISREDESLIMEASFCCEDRWDLIPELIETLKSLRLSPVKAEMVTFGGRIRNVLIVSGDKYEKKSEVVEFLKQGLKSLVHGPTSSHHTFKRQRQRQRTQLP